MVDWNEEEYKKLNQLVAERLPKHKYVSINGNHQHHVTLSLEYHVLMRGTGYTADDLRKLDSMMIRKHCPAITLVSRKTQGNLNYRSNGDNRWMHLADFPPKDKNGNQMGVKPFVDQYVATATTKRRSIGNDGLSQDSSENTGGGKGSSHNTPQTTQQKRQKRRSNSSPGLAQEEATSALSSPSPPTQSDLEMRGAQGWNDMTRDVGRGGSRRLLLMGLLNELSNEDMAHAHDLLKGRLDTVDSDIKTEDACDTEMRNLRAALLHKNRSHGSLVKDGFFDLRSIEQEIAIFEEYAPRKFKDLICDATSGSEHRWRERASKALRNRTSINSVNKKFEFEGASIIDELDRLEFPKKVQPSSRS